MNHCLLFGVNNYHRSAGAHRIASHLRLEGWDAEVIDFSVRWPLEKLKEIAKSRINHNTKFFGFSFIFNRVPEEEVVIEFIQWVKINYPDIVLIGGGQGIMSDKFSDLDYYIVGYGEIGLRVLLSYLFANGEKPNFDASLSLVSKKTKMITTIHKYPAHPLPDAIIKYEPRDFFTEHEFGQIEFSRGCKFKCSFCNFPILGVKGDYTRDQESVYEQLMYNYDNYGIRDYSIADETFNDYTEKITKFADVVDRLPWKPFMASFIRADLLVSRKRDREELLRMGVTAHYYGIETFNEKAGKYIGKGMNPEKLKAGMIEVKDYFKKHVGNRYKGTIALIAGLPGETVESLEQTKKWLIENWRDQIVAPNVLEIHKPIPGARNSTLDEEYEKLGYREIQLNNETMLEKMKMVIDHDNFDIKVGDREGFSWENNDMSIYDAILWTAQIENKVYRIGNIDLKKPAALKLAQMYCDDNGNVLPLDKKLSLTSTYHSKTLGPNFQIFVDRYIEKKLSL